MPVIETNDYRIEMSNKSKLISKSMKIVLKEPFTERIKTTLGDSTSVLIEIQDLDGNVLPITETFGMPIKRIGGEIVRTIPMEFNEGVCNQQITWEQSGEFEINQKLVNMHLPPEKQFYFSRVFISVMG